MACPTTNSCQQLERQESLKAEALGHINPRKAYRQFEALAEEHSQHPVVLVPWIKAFMRSGKPGNARKARQLARELTSAHPDNPDYFALLAVANENAGRSIEATEAKAHERHLSGHNYQAVLMAENFKTCEVYATQGDHSAQWNVRTSRP